MKIVILTGAGISAESGIDTFRAKDGLWEQYRIEDVATPEAFARNPDLVHGFYNMRRAALKTVAPNPAHFALAELEAALESCGGTLTLVTQNVDDLHARAGSKNLIHMHGRLGSHLCSACRKRWPSMEDTSTVSVCPKCNTKGTPRPDIVWFGEMPYAMNTIEDALNACDLFVSIGTSGAVYPAAGFVQMARASRKHTLEINLEPSAGSPMFDQCRHGKAGTLVPIWTQEIIDAL